MAPAALQMPFGMEIDLGGIGKEYAVDRAVDLIARRTDVPYSSISAATCAFSGPRRTGNAGAWPSNPRSRREPQRGLLEITQGGLRPAATPNASVMKNGLRLGHILNPKTGKPVVDRRAR